MEKQTGAQRKAEADRRNENSAGAAAVERTAVQEESGGTEAFGFLLFFLLSRFACKQGAGYYILDKNIAWIL